MLLQLFSPWLSHPLFSHPLYFPLCPPSPFLFLLYLFFYFFFFSYFCFLFSVPFLPLSFQIPYEMRVRVRQYFINTKRITTEAAERSLLQLISPSMRGELLLYHLAPWIQELESVLGGMLQSRGEDRRKQRRQAQ